MTSLQHPSKFKRAAGSAIAEGALTMLAAFTGGVIAPVLPVLSKSLAAALQERIEGFANEVANILSRHEAAIKDLSDEQYKLANEAVLAALHTTQAEKLAYLKNVVENAVISKNFGAHDATMLSRVIRDISADEACFLARSFQYEGVHLLPTDETTPLGGNVLAVRHSAPDAIAVAGLLSLGLIKPPSGGFDSGVLRFSRPAAKVLALLSTPGTACNR